MIERNEHAKGMPISNDDAEQIEWIEDESYRHVISEALAETEEIPWEEVKAESRIISKEHVIHGNPVVTEGEQMVSVIDAATQLGLNKFHLFKILKRLSIETTKQKGDARNRGQSIAYITTDDFRRIQEYLKSSNSTMGSDRDANHATHDNSLEQSGCFYLIQLEPNHDPGRFKLGFAISMPERLRQHRCSAPYAKVLKTWPCKQLWEKTLIEWISHGTERLHTEVFRTDSIESIQEKCERIFELAPKLRKGRS